MARGDWNPTLELALFQLEMDHLRCPFHHYLLSKRVAVRSMTAAVRSPWATKKGGSWFGTRLENRFLPGRIGQFDKEYDLTPFESLIFTLT